VVEEPVRNCRYGVRIDPDGYAHFVSARCVQHYPLDQSRSNIFKMATTDLFFFGLGAGAALGLTAGRLAGDREERARIIRLMAANGSALSGRQKPAPL
jgi:hypothetical protein